MSKTILDIELKAPLRMVFPKVPSGCAQAVLFRYDGRPIKFWLVSSRADRTLTPADLRKQIQDHARLILPQGCEREKRTPSNQGLSIKSLTIAVCTKDRPAQLSRCLDSIRDGETSARAGSLGVEILVVDNAPSDGQTFELVGTYSGVRYVCEPRPGLNFARNRALKEAQGELLAFVDDDVMVDRTWLDGLLEALEENPDAAAFTGLILPSELCTEAQVLFERYGGFRKGFEKRRFGPRLPGEPFYPCRAWIFGVGANMAFRRDVLQKLGGFDEALDTGETLPGGGDLDMFYRIIRAGHSLVYEPRYLVFHEHRREMEAFRRQLVGSWGVACMAYVMKTYRSDPSKRFELLWLIVWWFLNEVWDLQKAFRGKHVLGPDLILDRLYGGITGLLGKYPRSVRRVEKLRREHVQQTS